MSVKISLESQKLDVEMLRAGACDGFEQDIEGRSRSDGKDELNVGRDVSEWRKGDRLNPDRLDGSED